MNLHIFKSNEIVQVLDESTYIWEAAKIIGLESDWSVRVKWVDWTSKPAVVITVPESRRATGVESWNVRRQKPTRSWSPTTRTRGTRNDATNTYQSHDGSKYRPFTGNPRKLTRHVKVSEF